MVDDDDAAALMVYTLISTSFELEALVIVVAATATAVDAVSDCDCDWGLGRGVGNVASITHALCTAIYNRVYVVLVDNVEVGVIMEEWGYDNADAAMEPVVDEDNFIIVVNVCARVLVERLGKIEAPRYGIVSPSLVICSDANSPRACVEAGV